MKLHIPFAVRQAPSIWTAVLFGGCLLGLGWLVIDLVFNHPHVLIAVFTGTPMRHPGAVATSALAAYAAGFYVSFASREADALTGGVSMVVDSPIMLPLTWTIVLCSSFAMNVDLPLTYARLMDGLPFVLLSGVMFFLVVYAPWEARRKLQSARRNSKQAFVYRYFIEQSDDGKAWERHTTENSYAGYFEEWDDVQAVLAAVPSSKHVRVMKEVGTTRVEEALAQMS